MAVSEEARSMSKCLDDDTGTGGIQISKGERKSLFILKCHELQTEKLGVDLKQNMKCDHLGSEKKDRKELALALKCQFCQCVHFLF